MRTQKLFVLYGFLGAVVAAGCGSSSSTSKDGGGGSGGAGGQGGGAGVDGGHADGGGAGADGGGAGSGGSGGAGGSASDGGKGGTGGASGGGGGTGGNGGGGDSGGGGTGGSAASDAGTDGSDGGHDGPTTCTTTFGAGNPVQFAFNGGANAGWFQFVGHDEANTGFTSSLGASFTEGHLCPGALQFGVNFLAYGSPTVRGESATTGYYFGDSPNNGRNWSAYKTLHAWIKIETADYLGLDGVYFYMKSGGGTKYRDAYGMSSSLKDWHELTIDLVNPGPAGMYPGVVASDIQEIGFEVVLQAAPPPGAPATPSQEVLLVDDIWLEALPPPPPSDAGTGDGAAGADASVDAGTGS